MRTLALLPTALGALLLPMLQVAPEPSRVTLDAFHGSDPIAGWIAAPSEGVSLTLSPDAGEDGRGALRMDYDFRGHGGWAAARKDFPRTLPENWVIRLRLRGEGPPQTLEFKLLDPSGKNVWWSVRRDFTFPRDWTTLTFRKRQVTFAWGPAGGGVLTDLGAIEITVTAASGGRGRVWIDELALDLLPPPGAAPAPLAEWQSAPGSGEEQTVRLDLGGRREIGGISLFWDADDYARLYDVEMSDDGTRWRLARSIAGGRGGRAWIFLPDTDAAFVRLRLHQSARGRGYALRELRAEPPEIADSPTKFLEAVAKEAPRGRWPRSLVGEQIYWTLVGVDGGSEKGLLSEDGALETGRGEYSVEPFLRAGGRFLGWAEASQIEHSLEEGDLPIPSVRRTYDGGLSLTVTAYADGSPDSSTMHARYRVENSGPAPVTAALYLALRPVQVNPPWQFLSTQGGAAPIRQVRWDADRRAVVVEDAHPVVASTPATAFGASSFAEGEIVARLAEGDMPKSVDAADPDGFASAALAFDLAVPSGGTKDVIIAVPLSASATSGTPASFEEGLSAAARDWRAKLSRVVITVPPEAEPVARAARSNLAWILINREGPRIRPGSRSYARSWIRDGSLTSVALMRLGHAEDAGAFLRWFAPYQFESGMVPCCVDARGADPVPENDSHGELIYLAAAYFRYTGDRASLETVWPHIVRAADYIDALRRQRRTDEYKSGEKRLYFGLL
ncbi:MAG: discoidin domain-containing protein, partial [Thermoanaerobaculia bacterium]